MRAWSLIRTQPHYRHEAFLAGLKKVGCEVQGGMPERVKPGDMLVIWNRYGGLESIADRFEGAGGIVLVAENGYLGVDRENRQRYALAVHAHNGRGQWWPQGPERFTALNVKLAPMRAEGAAGHVLVAPNRSFGMPGGVMPSGWGEATAARYRAAGHKVVLRHHPGNHKAPVALDEHLAQAALVVVWSSSVGVQALVNGIPVRSEAPWWICKSWREIGRERALADLAWAQWSVEELASGAAFDHLLSAARQGQVAPGV